MLAGKFTFPDNVQFKKLLNQAQNPDIRIISVDMTGVEFVDSAALGMLMLLHNQAQEKGASVTLQSAKGQVDRVLRLSKFDELFTMIV